MNKLSACLVFMFMQVKGVTTAAEIMERDQLMEVLQLSTSPMVILMHCLWFKINLCCSLTSYFLYRSNLFFGNTFVILVLLWDMLLGFAPRVSYQYD